MKAIDTVRKTCRIDVLVLIEPWTMGDMEAILEGMTAIHYNGAETLGAGRKNALRGIAILYHNRLTGCVKPGSGDIRLETSDCIGWALTGQVCPKRFR